MSQPTIDLTSELLRGMRLSGVNYRRIETSRPFGVGFSAVAGKAQFHFISRGPVLLRMASGEQFTLETHEGQTLEKVAFRLGYQSLAAFSRAFKRITGQPPGALRATVR